MNSGITIEMLAKESQLSIEQGISTGGVAVQMLHAVAGVIADNGDAVAIEVRAAREVEFQCTSGVLQWRYASSGDWKTLVSLDGLVDGTLISMPSLYSFPVQGSPNKLYLDTSTGKMYIWYADEEHYRNVSIPDFDMIDANLCN